MSDNDTDNHQDRPPRPTLEDLYGLSGDDEVPKTPLSPTEPVSTDQPAGQPPSPSESVSRPSPSPPAASLGGPLKDYHLAGPPVVSKTETTPPPPPQPLSYLEQFTKEEASLEGSPAEEISPPSPEFLERPGLSRLKKLLPFALGSLVLLFFLIFAFRLLKNLPFFAPVKPLDLTYWGLWEPEAVIQPLIDEFEKQNSGITIDYQKQSHLQYRERLQSALAQQEGPDIFRIHNTWYPMFKNHLAPAPSAFFTPQQIQEDFYPLVAADFLKNDRLVALPLGLDFLVLFYNIDLFDQAGLSLPRTWNEFRATSQKATRKTAAGQIQVAGAALGTASNVEHWQDILSLMMLQNGVDFSRVDATILPDGSNAGVDVLNYYVSFAQGQNRTWDETLPNSTLAFAGNQLVFYFGPSWEVFTFLEANPDLNFALAPVPQLESPGVNFASYWAEAVNNKLDPKAQEAAWKFLSFLAKPESLQKLYQNASQTRLFGPIYPRPALAASLQADPLASVVVAQAPTARSWYLVSRTRDGDTGLNSRLSKYFEDAVNAVLRGQSAQSALKTVAAGLNQILSAYETSP